MISQAITKRVQTTRTMPMQLAPMLNRHAEARRVENVLAAQATQRDAAQARQQGRRKFGTALSMSALNVKKSSQRRQ